MKLEKQLEKILKYYEKKYKINIDFELIDDFCFSCCSPDLRDFTKSSILISIENIENLDLKNRFEYKNLDEKIIITLLHEIGHSLQYKKEKDYFVDTYNTQSRLEHNHRYYETEADIFVRAELKKWIKKGD